MCLCFYNLFVVLQGNASCEIENHGGVVTLRPLPGCVCLLNEREVAEPCRLAQGQLLSSTKPFVCIAFKLDTENYHHGVIVPLCLISHIGLCIIRHALSLKDMI